ncbi:hypothetical protein WMF37_35115 [Sorangium sp. So ce291]|uniref:hypothetical protein n=1 Tax=Sorangium sp. So ce291 TaxID=3133294 RepID=UPI003F62483F
MVLGAVCDALFGNAVLLAVIERQVGRWQAGGGVLGHERLEVRCDAGAARHR